MHSRTETGSTPVATTGPVARRAAATARWLPGLVSVAVLVTAATAWLAAPAADASGPPPEWVSTAPVGAGASCASPGFDSITAALAAAAPGATIHVCAGTYPGQLAITQSVKLVAADGPVTVLGPASPADNLTPCDASGGSQPNEDVVDICGSGSPSLVSVTIKGFTIEGQWPAAVCYDSIYGVAVLGGAKLTLTNSSVTDIGGSALADGCQGGVGIEVGLAAAVTTPPTPGQVGTAVLTGDDVSAYQKNGITVDGVGSSATITQTTVTGVGPTSAIAQNGIQISDGATGTIADSFVSGNECDDTAGGCGPDGLLDTQSAGVLFFDAGAASVTGSTVNGNDIGVYNGQDVAWQYFSPPATPTPTVEAVTGDSLANRYENVVADQGWTAADDDTMTAGEVGLEVLQYSGQTLSPSVTAKNATVTGATTAAVEVRSDQNIADQPVSLSVTRSQLQTSNAAGVVDQSTSVVKATHDWWGDPSGPSSWAPGTGSAVSADVNFFPWATSSSLTSSAACTETGSHETSSNSGPVILCAPSGSTNAYLAYSGSGKALLLGNAGNDQLIGSATGTTYVIAGSGANFIDGNGGDGFVQLRGDTSDVLDSTQNDTVAAS